MIFLFLLLLFFFEADRLVFFAMNHGIVPFTWDAFVDTWWHGLPLDVATACYLLIPSWIITGIGIWVRIRHIKAIDRTIAAIISTILALVWVVDACLYGFWGIKLDGTVFNYLDSPQGALSSVSAGYMAGVIVAFAATVAIVYPLFWRAMPAHTGRISDRKRKVQTTVAWILLGGLIFLGIRGGVGKSTANVGRAYYSDVQFLNHAAVNPVFSIFSSMQRSRDYAESFNLLPEDERADVFRSLGYDTCSVNSIPLLNTSRPNVIVVIMEGCGGVFVHAVDPQADPQVTPHLNRLAREGVVFTQCYANSFRTDRGTLCTLSGYPSFPDVSVMKIPSKCTHLPSLASSLRKAGYSTEFLYGGDINFTNTNGYLLGTGYERTYGDTSFPSSVRRTHDWGVTDRIAFDTLYQHVLRQPADRPWHIGFLTLASHEPWVVPYDRIKGDKVANSMAYLDDCIGHFIGRLRRTPQWANTLVVFLPDHGINYPEGISDADERRSHIPLILTGGAVKEPRTVTTLCNQTDLVATLLGQLGLPHGEFRFSRDVLSDTYRRPSAVHSWSEGIYYKDSTGISVINVLAKPVSVMRSVPNPSPQREKAAKAFLQTIYDDLGAL